MPSINSLTQSRVLRSSIKDVTNELGRLQEQISTGLKAKTFSDHGATNARQVVSLRNQTFRIDSYTRTIDRLDLRAERVEISLDQINKQVDETVSTSLSLDNQLAKPVDLSRSAQAAFSNVYASLTPDSAGQFVFSGTEANRSPLLPMTQIQAGVQAAIAAAVPAGDPTAINDAVNTFFADETNWYQGGTLPSGIEIAHERPVQSAVLANDPAFRDVLAGLSVMAFADPTIIGSANYTAAADIARTTMATGSDQMDRAVARNGMLRAEFETTKEGHDRVKNYAETQLGSIENVDVYEAVTKLQALQTQLEATYSITAQLRQLTLTNYLR